MTREQRRLRLAQRQHLLAEVSQNAAMRALADALAQENRSAALARRSRELAQGYGARGGICDGGALAQVVRFAAALATLSGQAEQARADASAQANWQLDALGTAQTRARRQSDRLAQAYAELATLREQRALEEEAAQTLRKGLAHNLHDPLQNQSPDPLRAPSASGRTHS